MNKDLFALVPNTFEPTLNENYEGIEQFLELEYQGCMTAELKKALAEKKQVIVIPKLLTTIAMATVLLLAACTPSSSGDTQQPLPEKQETLGPYKKLEATIEARKQGLNQYLITITTNESFDGYTPHYRNKADGGYHTSRSSFKKTNDGSAVLLERIDLSKEPLTTYYLEYIVGEGPGAAYLSAQLTPDLVINGITPLSSLNADGHIEVDQLILEDWARLQTKGTDIEIKANTIISKSGSITSEDLGGHVKLSARDLFGDLNIEATGTVSHPGTLDVVIENMGWLQNRIYGCGIGSRYNTSGNGHTSAVEIKNNHCWNE